MKENPANPIPGVNRRQFLKNSTLAAATAAAAVNFPAVLRAQTKQPIRAAIVGLGGRGGGAGGNFNDAAKVVEADAKIVAIADLFPEVAASGTEKFGVPQERCFSGFDAFAKVLELQEVNYVILATPPGFRAAHFKAAIAAGKNVFMEKPVAVDGTGIRVVYAAADEAKAKNLKVAAGTQRRHRPSYIETVNRVHDGAIGDVTALRMYWVNGGPIWHRGDHGNTEMERQIRNWYHYIWLCGDHICEQHVHNLDIANWIMNGHPVKAWGMGARQQLDGKSGEIWDNFEIEYQYANGVRMASYCGQIKRSWASVSEAAVGTKGIAELHDGHPNFTKTKDGQMWRPTGIKADDGYVNEHCDLMNAIMNDTPLNEARQVADSTLTAIMGREAAYSGAEVEWDTALNSPFMYGPPMLYENCAKMEFGAFRTLQPPMPSEHDIYKDPPMLPLATA